MLGILQRIWQISRLPLWAARCSGVLKSLLTASRSMPGLVIRSFTISNWHSLAAKCKAVKPSRAVLMSATAAFFNLGSSIYLRVFRSPVSAATRYSWLFAFFSCQKLAQAGFA